MPLKGFVIGAAAVVAAFAAGWFSAASGRSVAREAARGNAIRADLADARADVLAGKVSLFRNSVGDAMAHFEDARRAVDRVEAALRGTSQAGAIPRLDAIVAHIQDTERLTSAFDPHAQNAADDTLDALQHLTGS